jgi:putative flippase GtrA
MALQYAISINISIATMRHYAFRSRGPIRREYARAWSVYLGMMALNWAWLEISAGLSGLNALPAQAAFVAANTIITYLLHKHFSFSAADA